MSKLLLNDDELKNVVGGASIDINIFQGKLTVDMTEDPTVSLQTLFNQFSGFLSTQAQQATVNQVMETLNSNPEITKCVINISSLETTYYVGSSVWTPSNAVKL